MDMYFLHQNKMLFKIRYNVNLKPCSERGRNLTLQRRNAFCLSPLHLVLKYTVVPHGTQTHLFIHRMVVRRLFC